MEGKVTWIAQDGAPIKKGDVLARLDDDELKRQVRDTSLEYENARAEVERTTRDRELERSTSLGAVDKAEEEKRILTKSNEVQINQARSQLDFTKAELERLTTEYKRKQKQADEKLVPLSQLETAEISMRSAAFAADKAQKDLDLQIEKAKSAVQQKDTDIENARFTVATAQRRTRDDSLSSKSRLDNIKRRLDEAQQRLGWCTIRAPSSGLVVLAKDWHRSEGRRVTRPGDQLGPFSALADIPDLSVMAVDCKIQEGDIGGIHRGQPVRIRLDERPTHPYHGRVTRISSVAEAVSPWDDTGFDAGTKIFTVTVELLERDSKHLLPGMNGTLEIVTRSIPSAVFVDKNCVFTRGDNMDQIVYVRHGKIFRPVVVTPGEESDTQVRILRGLKGKEWVATSDPTLVSAG
jgi:multidrug resistance efflux pump